MSNAPAATNQNEQKKQEARQPIAIERLFFNAPNPAGIKMPEGYEGKGEKIRHNLVAGVEGDVKTEIDFLPWLQAFRVKRSRKLTSTGADKKEVVTWKPMGGPFFIPQAVCVWVPVGE